MGSLWRLSVANWQRRWQSSNMGVSRCCHGGPWAEGRTTFGTRGDSGVALTDFVHTLAASPPVSGDEGVPIVREKPRPQSEVRERAVFWHRAEDEIFNACLSSVHRG